MDIILNQIAIWHESGAKELNVKAVPAGRTYRTVDSPVYSKTNTVTYRFAKDYTVKKVKFCLMVLSDISEPSIVEKQMDDIAKSITKEQALEIAANSTVVSFKYLPAVVKGDK